MLSTPDSIQPDSVQPDGIVSAEQTFPVPLICSNDKISATAAARASFTNRHSHTRRSDTIVRSDGNSTIEAAYSPKYRELQYERDLKRLQAQLNDTEDQFVRVELELSETKKKIEALIEEITRKKARIRDLEKNEKLYSRTQEEMEAKVEMLSKQLDQMQRHNEVQKERLMEYKENEDKWEEKKASLEEALNNRNSSVLFLERKLRDANDELLNRSKALQNAENECSRLQREAEELRRSNETQREEYQASVADWRCRLEKTVADHLSSCAADMERNANVAREMRAKTEEVERLQRLLENEKKQVQSVVDEWSRKFQENSETVTSKLASLEAELARRDEIEKNKVCDQCEYLKKRNQIEMEEQAVRQKSAQSRIEELERRVAEGEQVLCKKKEEVEYLLSEKDKIVNEREEVLDELDRKTESLKEARFIMDGLREEIAAFMTETGRGIPMNVKDDEKRGEVYRQLSRVIMIVEAYGRQFEQLEMRLAVEEKRQRHSVHDVDVTGTINDLQYRLFAASQKLAVYEKERVEWKCMMQRLEDREEHVKQKNSELTEEVNRWLRELDGLRQEKANMQKMVSDYRAELESKSTQLERISKSLEDSQKNNTLHLQLVNTLKEEYDSKINMMEQQEKHHIEEKEELRSLSMKKEEQMQALHKMVSSLEKALNPCKKENVQLRLEVDALKKENEKYKASLDVVKSADEETVAESPRLIKTKSLLHKSREHVYGASHSTTRDDVHHKSHDPSAILTTRNSGKKEDDLRIGATHARAMSAHRACTLTFLKRTSFYQMSRTLSEFKSN